MTLYSIHMERDGVVHILGDQDYPYREFSSTKRVDSSLALRSTYDLEEAKRQIREIEDHWGNPYEGWDFVAVAENGRVFMLVDDWEEI